MFGSGYLMLLRESGLTETEEKIETFPIFASEDLRYLELKKKNDHQSNAVVIAEMDVSVSMGTMKKYLSRSMLFWLLGFLRTLYSRVEVRFIIHTTMAKIVDEETAFKIGESGGTNCYSAHELARNLIETEYSTNNWNVYVWHFSDGEDFDPRHTCEEISKLLDLGINMFGYAEVQPTEDGQLFEMMVRAQKSTLWEELQQAFALDEYESKQGGMRMMTSGNMPILGVAIETREHLLLALKEFLKRDRWRVAA